MPATQTQPITTSCQWGACSRRALYLVTEELAGNQPNNVKLMCSQHRIATSNEAWSYGALVTWTKL
jgi:hypothetical protein